MRAEARLRTLFLALLAAGPWAFLPSAAAAGKSPSAATPLDTAFRAAYPVSPRPARSPVAGVALAKLVLPGLSLSARSEHAAADGGIVLSFADRAGVVRVLVHVAVFADAEAARQEVDAELHGVSMQLQAATDATLGEVAWADEGGKGESIVVAAQANLAYSVSVLAAVPGLSAANIAGLVRAAMVAGEPTFPLASVTLPATIDARRGSRVQLTIPSGSTYTLHAEGGYIAGTYSAQVVRPLAPGVVTVRATVVDALGRVTVAAATTRAQ